MICDEIILNAALSSKFIKNIEPISVVKRPSSPVSDKSAEFTALSKNSKVAFSFSKKLKTL